MSANKNDNNENSDRRESIGFLITDKLTRSKFVWGLFVCLGGVAIAAAMILQTTKRPELVAARLLATSLVLVLASGVYLLYLGGKE